jgi:hypothetical protein
MSVVQNQSKHVGADGKLRYDADGSEVFPGPTGVRQPPVREQTRCVVEDVQWACQQSFFWQVSQPGVDSFDVRTSSGRVFTVTVALKQDDHGAAGDVA